MATLTTENPMTMVDALWTLISPLDNSQKKELTKRINGSLVVPLNDLSKRRNMQSVEDILDGFHLQGDISIPAEEMGKGAVAQSKYM